MKKVKVLYSDSRAGIKEEIKQYKQELKKLGKRYIRSDCIYHLNGHVTALVMYRDNPR